MLNVFKPADVTVFLPVGGRATRALEVTADTIPKHLIMLGNGLPILEVACRQLQLVGFRRFVFCTGHHQEQIANFVREGLWVSHENVDYEISVEFEPLGPEGAILAAIRDFGITGQAMFIAGDVMVPWDALVTMNERHASRQADITVGLTSYITERTTDVGKIIVDPEDGRVVRVHGRTEKSVCGDDEQALTSAGLSVVSIPRYSELCSEYETSRGLGDKKPFGLRDDVLPWALRKGKLGIYGHDLHGEVLDLGTPENIRYGQENWSEYVLD